MLRRLIADLLDTYLSWLVDPINQAFDFLLDPAVSTFTDYAGRSNATPGLLEWVIATGIGLVLFLAVGIAGMYILLDILSPGFNRVYRGVTGQTVTRSRRLIAAVVLNFGLLAMDAILHNEFYATQMTERLANDLAVIMGMLSGELPSPGVGIPAFTWGVLGDPMWEFVIQVGAVIGLIATVVWKFTEYNENLVAGTLLLLSSGVWMFAELQGIQVFPVSVRLAFVIQVFILWGLMSAIAGVLVMAGWGLLEWFPWVTYDQGKPKKLYITFHGLALLAMFPLFGDNTMALLAWFSAMLALYGGGEKALRIVLGYDQECHPDPETGLETCEWTRGE